MRRVEIPTQEELDDIDDNKWRRKSYALAQHNALPVPMPLPIHPPPKPCPPTDPVIIRPPRIRPHPPAPGYRPSAGGYRPSRMAKPRLPGISDRLPTLAEGGSACPTPEMQQKRAFPMAVTPPVPPGLPQQQKPTFSTFQGPPLVPRSPSPTSHILEQNEKAPPNPYQSPVSTFLPSTAPLPPSPSKPPPPQNSPLPRKFPPSLPENPPPTHRPPRQVGRRGMMQPPSSPRPSVPPPAVPIMAPSSPKIHSSTPAAVPVNNSGRPREPGGELEPIRQAPGIPSKLDPSTQKQPFLPFSDPDSHPPVSRNNPRVIDAVPPTREPEIIPPVTQINPKLVGDKSGPLPTSPISQEDKTTHFPNSPVSPDLPPTPTSQHLPPTPPSLSRSSTPTSLGCPRTPTSIRAAPNWQPVFSSSPSNKTPKTSSPNSEAGTPTSCLTPATTPRPLTQLSPASSSQVFPPTPPSSLSHVGAESFTPASSLSSLNQGPLKTSMGEDEVAHGPDGGDNGVKLPYPAVLDVSSLHEQNNKGPRAASSSVAVPPIAVVTSPFTNNAVEGAAEGYDGGKALHDPDSFTTYKDRFWVLAVFSGIAFLQTVVWGTFGPIAESALVAFPNWTDATIAAFPNWGPIIVVVFTIPMMWLTQKLGLRLGVIVCAILITVGTMIRCFTSQETPFTVLCHVSSILFAFAACMTLSLPAMLAATWFPANERITATAVGTLMCQLGAAGMYLSPLMVRYPTENPANPDQEQQDIRSDIMVLMYTHFGAATLLLIMVIAYFPARPLTPPSASSAKERVDYFSGIKDVVKNSQLLLVLGVYAFSFGVPVVWIGVINFSLLEINIHQEQAMGVAVTAVVCSCLGSFITARITDKMYGHLRNTIMILLGLSSVFFLWFLLISTKVIATSLAQVYVAVSGGLCFELSTVPLLVEFAVELGYPIPESVTGATLTFVFNVVALVFLGIFQIPNIQHLWVSYVLLACVSLTILPLIFVKETHKRSDDDRKYINSHT